MKAFFLLALFLLTKQAQSQQPFISSYDWDPAPSAQFGFEKDRIVLKMDKGISWLRDVAVGNGTIEVDIAVSNKIGFAGLVFRRSGATNSFEQVYVRMHKSRQADAVQYNPYFNNESSWQLYPELQAWCAFPQEGWLQLKIKLRESCAFVYVQGATTPTLTIPNLRTGNAAGQIGLWCLGTISFSNLRISTNDNEQAIAASETPATTLPAITEYELSPAFVFDPGTPGLPPANIHWETARTEPDGLLNVSRFRKKWKSGQFENNSIDAVYLRFTRYSEEEGLHKLQFEFTNRCWIYCNDWIVYNGNNSFHARGNLFRGELDKKMGSQAIYLPLKKGANKIVVLLSSLSDGWGWMARWEEGIKSKPGKHAASTPGFAKMVNTK